MATIFPEMVAPVEKALSRLRLGWGWREGEIILLDLEKIGRPNFPAKIRFYLNMLEISTEADPVPTVNEEEAIFAGDSEATTPVFPMQRQSGMALAIRLPIPEDRLWRSPRVLAPLLRESLLALGSKREELAQPKEAKEELPALAGDIVEKDV